jgi:hypothetical protein
MRRGSKARRPGERTARAIGEDCRLALYAERFENSRRIPPGTVIEVPGRPGRIVGRGCIEGEHPKGIEDYPVEFDAAAVIDHARIIRLGDRAESTEIVLAKCGCEPTRISLRAPLGAVLRMLRRARR